MHLWITEKRLLYLKRLISHRQGPAVNTKCSGCGIGKAIWRCLSCIGADILCVLCMWNSHSKILFHWIQKWNGWFFQSGSLWQVGVKLYTDHKGSPCPHSIVPLPRTSQPLPYLIAQCNQILAKISLTIGMNPWTILQLVGEAMHLPGRPGPATNMFWQVSQLIGSTRVGLLQNFISIIWSAEIDSEKELASANYVIDKNERQGSSGEEQEPPINDLSLAFIFLKQKSLYGLMVNCKTS